VGLSLCIPSRAQRERGEVRVEVKDGQGAAAEAEGELASQANQFKRAFRVGSDGKAVIQDVPFGVYVLTVNATGFAAWKGLVEVRSEVPARVNVTLGVAPVETQVEVSDSATLLDPYQTGTVYSLGRAAVGESLASQPGRSLSDLVNEQPGWVYEANGVLHPRGSEYDVQYVVDGLPLTQNRSPAFSSPVNAENVEGMRVLTASYPAEYGRKLGGIVELTTRKDFPSGWHGGFEIEGGSFANVGTSMALLHGTDKNRFSLGANGFHTDRYLDPPVLENFTNRANSSGMAASYEHIFSDRDRISISLFHNETRFLAPNEFVQQEAGQRQDLASRESGGQIYYQHTISPLLLWTASGGVRDSTFSIRSNSLSTPIIVSQDRGYREGYVRTDLAGHHGHHDWKVGIDSIFSPIREALQYVITDPSQFDPNTLQQFQFAARKWDVEPSFYAQDQLHWDNWNVTAGLRFDHYGFVVHESAWSPRLAVSRFVPSWSLLLHASYDRVFQTPAVENLLLASSPDVVSLDPEVLRLPVRPARANFYEAGLTKSIFGKLRMDANLFRRDFRNFSDDDILLDTGVSFPIAFERARIIGEELKLRFGEWRRFSGFVSFANQSGWGRGPVTGGLFLGEEASNVLADNAKFAITQDQRNTLRARIRCQATRRVWLAAGFTYGSGLPVELEENPDIGFLLSQYGQKILNRVDFSRGRVRPNFSLDASAGTEFFHKEHRSLMLQVEGANLTNRVNVINFAGLFSGTAVAVPRSVSASLRATF
jgi:outer membrane cobalamin receptor